MLRLRPYKKCDAARIVTWIKDEWSMHQWCGRGFSAFPLTPDDLNARYEGWAFDDSVYPMTAYDETGPVGHLYLAFKDEAKTVLRFCCVIVDGEQRGKGYGTAMLRLALRYAFDFLGAERVTLGVYENNPSACRFYRALGFTDTEERTHSEIMGTDWVGLEMEMKR